MIYITQPCPRNEFVALPKSSVVGGMAPVQILVHSSGTWCVAVSSLSKIVVCRLYVVRLAHSSCMLEATCYVHTTLCHVLTVVMHSEQRHSETPEWLLCPICQYVSTALRMQPKEAQTASLWQLEINKDAHNHSNTTQAKEHITHKNKKCNSQRHILYFKLNL